MSRFTKRSMLTLVSVMVAAVGAGAAAPPARAQSAAAGYVCVDSNYRGTCIVISQDATTLAGTALGVGRASSVIVNPGYSFSLYRQTSFGGLCQTFVGNAPDLGKQAIGNDTAASIRLGATCPAAVLYKDDNYRGASATSDSLRRVVGSRVQYAVPGMQETPIGNAQLSSIQVTPGHSVSIYSGLLYGGRCITVTTDVPSLRALGFNDDTRSVWVDPPSPCFSYDRPW